MGYCLSTPEDPFGNNNDNNNNGEERKLLGPSYGTIHQNHMPIAFTSAYNNDSSEWYDTHSRFNDDSEESSEQLNDTTTSKSKRKKGKEKKDKKIQISSSTTTSSYKANDSYKNIKDDDSKKKKSSSIKGKNNNNDRREYILDDEDNYDTKIKSTCIPSSSSSSSSSIPHKFTSKVQLIMRDAHREQEVSCIAVAPDMWSIREVNPYPKFSLMGSSSLSGTSEEEEEKEEKEIKKERKEYPMPNRNKKPDYPLCSLVVTGAFGGSVIVWSVREREYNEETLKEEGKENKDIDENIEERGSVYCEPIVEIQKHTKAKAVAPSIISLIIREIPKGNIIDSAAGVGNMNTTTTTTTTLLTIGDRTGTLSVWDLSMIIKLWNNSDCKEPIVISPGNSYIQNEEKHNEENTSTTRRRRISTTSTEEKLAEDTLIALRCSPYTHNRTMKGLLLIKGKKIRRFRRHITEDRNICIEEQEEDLLISWGTDKVIKIWSIPHLTCLFILKGHKAAVSTVISFPSNIKSSFVSTPSCLQLLSVSYVQDGGSEKGAVRIWKVPRSSDNRNEFIKDEVVKPKNIRADVVVRLSGKVHGAALNFYAEGMGLAGMEHRPQLIAVVASTPHALDLIVLDLEQGLILHQFDDIIHTSLEALTVLKPKGQKSASVLIATGGREEEDHPSTSSKGQIQIRNLDTLEMIHQIHLESHVSNIQIEDGWVLCSLVGGNVALVMEQDMKEEVEWGKDTITVLEMENMSSTSELVFVKFVGGHILAGQGCNMYVW